MKTHAAIALLLTFCLGAMPAAAHPRLTQENEHEKITPEEEREARKLASLFVKRFRETNDIAPLIDELFVEDVGKRLRYDTEGIPMIFVERDVAWQAAPAELSRFYIAQFNFVTLTLEYWMTYPHVLEADDEDAREPELEQMFPSEVAGVLRSDPNFSAFINGEGAAEKESSETEEGVGSASGPSDQETDEIFIKTLTALREVTLTTEKAADALRPHVPPFPVLREALKDRIDDKNLVEVHAPSLETHEEAFYGFPPATRFICLKVEPVHNLQVDLCMVVIDGRIRIVAAFPVVSD